MTRKEILEIVEGNSTGVYDTFKDAIGVDDSIDAWFSGLVRSVKAWSPNTKLLVFVGEFSMQSILPNDLGRAYTSSNSIDEDMLYSRMIAEVPMRERVLKIYKEYNFLCQIPRIEKRLCSYCTVVSEWKYPKRKGEIVIKLRYIDWEKLNNINKLDLWIEIFKKF